jgi:hypothetical protein
LSKPSIESSIATSTNWPRPVWPRWKSAVAIANAPVIRPEVGDDHVGGLRETVDERLRLGLREVERHAALVRVDRHPRGAEAALGPLARDRREAHAVAGARLDLDHVRALHRELPGRIGAREHVGEVDHAHAGEGAGVGFGGGRGRHRRLSPA